MQQQLNNNSEIIVKSDCQDGLSKFWHQNYRKIDVLIVIL